MGYQHMQLRRGKPARWFKGVWYEPGIPIDPDDPNLEDPKLRLQLEPVPPPKTAPAEPERPPATADTYHTAGPYEADDQEN